MKSLVFVGLMVFGFYFLTKEVGTFSKLKQGIVETHKHEKAALILAKENRELRAQLNKLKYEISAVKTKNDFLQIKLNKRQTERKIASVTEKKEYKDLVQYDVYKWSPDKLLGIAGKEFHFKHFEKAAQFYNELITRHPDHKLVTDKVLFAAGISAYESGKHYPWAQKYLAQLVKHHGKSKFYRGAKLWLALSKLNMGDKKSFYLTVEEFRQKYRNTSEWKILSKHYETISRNYTE